MQGSINFLNNDYTSEMGAVHCRSHEQTPVGGWRHRRGLMLRWLAGAGELRLCALVRCQEWWDLRSSHLFECWSNGSDWELSAWSVSQSLGWNQRFSGAWASGGVSMSRTMSWPSRASPTTVEMQERTFYWWLIYIPEAWIQNLHLLCHNERSNYQYMSSVLWCWWMRRRLGGPSDGDMISLEFF